MDKEQLSQLKYLKSEIEILKKQISDLDYNITTDSVKGSSPYFPYIERNFLITGLDYQVHDDKLDRLQRKLNRRVEELIDLVEETHDYINNIDNSEIRQIITLKYVNGLTWEQVAFHLGYADESVPRKKLDRYLK
ncbi:hypothetical protein [Tissierella praeacuta]|uniref:hypothetical protein n=1 Tax=Tissierella praeacuta TaxID=43131 RepID=UPI0033423076